MDALEELKKALADYNCAPQFHAWSEESSLIYAVENYLPALLAELEARRAAMRDDVNPAGFSARATLELK